MPLVLSQLIWLATIYEIDVRQCQWETGYQTDLKKMAYDIVRNDPYTKIIRKTPPQRAARGARSEPGPEGKGLKPAP
jgi:hypothetical protein